MQHAGVSSGHRRTSGAAKLFNDTAEVAELENYHFAVHGRVKNRLNIDLTVRNRNPEMADDNAFTCHILFSDL